jgi:hypothetical protein
MQFSNIRMRLNSSTSHYLLSSRGSAVVFRYGIVGFLALAMTGCGSSSHWDTELACSGQEQSSTYFSGDEGAHAVEKKYTNTIDFHLRGNNALVKSFMAAIDTDSKDSMTFSAKNQVAWINGKFDKAEGRLMVVEGRTLMVEGKAQQIRTTGQYICRSAGGAVV